jgi:hypothetical protein
MHGIFFCPSQCHLRSLSNFIRFHKPKPTLKNNYFFKTKPRCKHSPNFRPIPLPSAGEFQIARSKSSSVSVKHRPSLHTIPVKRRKHLPKSMHAFILPSSVDSRSREPTNLPVNPQLRKINSPKIPLSISPDSTSPK